MLDAIQHDRWYAALAQVVRPSPPSSPRGSAGFVILGRPVMIEVLGNLLCDIARWVAIIHGHFDNRSRIVAEQERAWMDAVAACRRMSTDDTDHITIARNRGNLFD